MNAAAKILVAVVIIAIAVGALFAPPWLISLTTIGLTNALVVLGLVILWRAGLVPFGQALYYAIGAYAVALLNRWTGLTDAFLLILVGAISAGITAFLVGFLLARYREIFFAMLSLAISMILYGVLVKTETLGSTDGFNVARPSFLGMAPHGQTLELVLFWLVLAISVASALGVAAYFRTVAGSLAVPIRDNEIRVEFLGLSVNRLVHIKLVIAGILGGLGGALAALVVGHVDPNMAYWTTSGGFVFVTILAGASSISAAFIGALLFEFVRSFALSAVPQAWQMILGSVLLVTILFLPDGLGSVFSRLRRRKAEPV